MRKFPEGVDGLDSDIHHLSRIMEVYIHVLMSFLMVNFFQNIFTKIKPLVLFL